MNAAIVDARGPSRPHFKPAHYRNFRHSTFSSRCDYWPYSSLFELSLSGFPLSYDELNLGLPTGG
jgi:hypothetical protein